MAQKHHRPSFELWKNLEPVVKQMRKAPTPAEVRMWNFLRGRRFRGYKFRRQHAIDRFVVDFFCADANLIIELDGPIHQSQVDEDQERQATLEYMGFTVIRFSNEQVFSHTEQVLSTILEHLHQD